MIIAISGGSGTLTELAIAYQADIPMIVIGNTGGWSDRLANQYFDNRKRRLVLKANTAEEAINMAIEHANQKINESAKKPITMDGVK